MQQRNFVLFMVLSFLILFGWVWVQNKIWPPQPKTPKDEKVVLKVDWQKYGQAAKAVNLIADSSLAVSGPLAAALDCRRRFATRFPQAAATGALVRPKRKSTADRRTLAAASF